MEMNSSSLDVTIRARKPYTITKQRERWTVEEHNRFLEAMKLYGRAWQRIEEHIGTKTAVQIRSHAQKFFSKLEREASAKGLQTEDAHEIKIPPPRPKRKPNNPYPRKPVFSASNVKDFPLYSALPGQVVQNIESPVEGGTETEASSISKEYLQEARPPEILALFEEAPCASPSSGSNIDNTVRGTPTLPSCGEFREFMTTESDAKDQPSMKSEINGNNIEINLEIGSLVRAESSALTIRSTSKMCEENKVHESDKLGDPELLEKGNAPSSVGYPRHVPVHVVDTGITKPLEIQSPSAITSCSDARASQYSSNTAHPPLHTAFPMHHSLNTFHTNPEALKSAAAYVSSTLSNFIIASLVENPVAHTAATIAASFWPYMTDKDACTDEVRNTDRNRTAYVEPCANLAAVAAATVSAASAWWISQGLIPICHSQFNLPSSVTPSVAHTPVTESTLCLNSDPKEERKEVDSFEPELSQVIDTTCPAPKSPLLSSESDASACGGLEGSKQIVTSDEPRKNLTSDFSEIDKTNARTQQYHSSCGSNTTSSSEREADNVHEDVKGASETLDLIHTFEVLANRRSKSTGNNNDSWKEVSDEGRLTFQALFSRDVLPQRFSQRDDIQNIEHAKSGSEEATKQESEKKETQKEKTVLIGCKSKCILTGFKPYKRCSVEANGMMISQVTEKNALKRIRTEGQAGRDAILVPVSGLSGDRNFSS